MSVLFDQKITKDINQASSKEWLETNGLGGWASSTIIGLHTRRYHGLLIAAMNPPLGRMLLLSKMPETIITAEGQFELDCNDFNGIIHPQGYQFLEKYTQDLFPEFEYQAGAVKIKKTIAMVYGENTTLINYEVIDSPGEFTFKLKPFVGGRDVHSLSRSNDHISGQYSFNEGILKIKSYPEMPDLFIKIKGADFHYSPDWYFNFTYLIERERVMDFKEDLFSCGDIYVKLKKGEQLHIVISTENPENKDGKVLFNKEIERKQKLIAGLPQDDAFVKTLTLAADQFVVKRGKDLKSIIAGYPWFSDWGRDTMISLPGLCLVTGRYEDAKKILKAFALVTDKGMIPNRFTDEGEQPEYNTVDATLWYFVAIYEYLRYSKDEEFVKKELYPILKEIIEWHIKGTRYNIKVDSDGLLFAGEPGSQLTWMDAKIDKWVVTPRIGKPVEINALWYNSLRIMEEFSAKFENKEASLIYKNAADNVQKIFLAKFVNPVNGALYDYINGEYNDPAIRPNQLFVISLPFALVNNMVAKTIIKITEEELLIPYGLRSLSYRDPQYISLYEGNQLARDGSYHQGSAWSWLIGTYLTAVIKTEGKSAYPKVKRILKQFERHFADAGIGTISEIFDGDNPYKPKGCMAQAWGVAEVLRVYMQYFVNQK